MPWDPVVLREALLREHYRGGQSFLVTPRIADLPDLGAYLLQDCLLYPSDPSHQLPPRFFDGCCPL